MVNLKIQERCFLFFFSNVENNVSHLRDNHGEADTRILLNQGYARLVIECRDSDVLLLLLELANQLSQEIWMKSGTTKKPCFVQVLDMNIPAEILKSLLAFHPGTVCDTTSQFTSRGSLFHFVVCLCRHMCYTKRKPLPLTFIYVVFITS